LEVASVYRVRREQRRRLAAMQATVQWDDFLVYRDDARWPG
jgi:hypothetical protein